MVVSGSYDPAGPTVPGVGVSTRVPDPLQRGLRAHSRAPEHRLGDTRDEDHTEGRRPQGVPHLQDPRRQGHRTHGDPRVWTATWKRRYFFYKVKFFIYCVYDKTIKYIIFHRNYTKKLIIKIY